MLIERRTSNAWPPPASLPVTSTGMSTSAQSYQRSPFAPTPALSRFQARAGNLRDRALAGCLPASVVTWWSQATAST
jgi:2-keto-3-deoxy-galactonokinase